MCESSFQHSDILANLLFAFCCCCCYCTSSKRPHSRYARAHIVSHIPVAGLRLVDAHCIAYAWANLLYAFMIFAFIAPFARFVFFYAMRALFVIKHVIVMLKASATEAHFHRRHTHMHTHTHTHSHLPPTPFSCTSLHLHPNPRPPPPASVNNYLTFMSERLSFSFCASSSCTLWASYERMRCREWNKIYTLQYYFLISLKLLPK